MSKPAPSLKGRALRLLGMREYARAELERKLKPHEAEPGVLSEVLDELQRKGFISEQRVLESVVNRKSGKLGAARIRQELHNRGLDAGAIKDAVAGLQSTEVDRARAVWQKKFGASSMRADAAADVDAAERGKQMRFLASRGFGTDTIRQVLAQAPGASAVVHSRWHK